MSRIMDEGSGHMKEDEPELSDQDRRAIEAIRRELDREFGDLYKEAAIRRERPKRQETRRHKGLAVGLGILAGLAVGLGILGALLAATAFVASRVLAPVPYGNSRESAATSGVGVPSGSGLASAPLFEKGGDSRPVSMDLTASPPARKHRSDVTPGRTSHLRVNRSDPCPPFTRVAAPPGRPDAPLASARRGSVARGDSQLSTIMALANPVREPRHVEAP